jgi:DNA invertase Pin-like site-specific DNA recombinase
MSGDPQKVRAEHLQRDAYLYVRQSTLHQVVENTESTERQYALRGQAVQLGWPTERVFTIDQDQGQSASTAADREGFQKLVAEVSMGRVGIVLGLEVSRLARNCSDWHRLLELCALTGTLILDEDGLYDPSHFNDRLLLGLKGTMSEAELHMLRTRLQGGIESKARRGELKTRLPTGLVYDDHDHVVFDPDRQVQQAFLTFFDVFRRQGAACATVRHFHQEGLLFPRRIRVGARKGDLIWVRLNSQQALNTLHNPRYAGAFVRGQTRTRTMPDGKAKTRQVPQEQWSIVLPNCHAGYITWEEFQQNQRRLRENSAAHGADRHRSPPREGPALLQGLVMCGRCGQPMTIRYRSHKGGLQPAYVCQRESVDYGEPVCQEIPGAKIDEAVGTLLLEMVTPLSLQVALEVQDALQTQLAAADRLRRQQVERARYEADLAKQRFMRVDPNNRLVADALEGEWNEKLRALNEAQETCERQRQADRAVLDEKQRAEVLSLSEDFPRLWRDPRVSYRERKRMVRLLVEDVTLLKGEEISISICFRGGATRSLTIPLPLPSCRTWQTASDIVAQIDRLLDQYTEGEIAAQLNQQGLRSGKGGRFQGRSIAHIRRAYRLKSRYDRLRETGMLTVKEMARHLGIATHTAHTWRELGILKGLPYNDKKQYLFEPFSGPKPVTWRGKKLSDPQRFGKVLSESTKEV